MTAYVNDEQKKEGAYGKAVKATLAATLAAGMVPAAAAFAEEPAEATAENSDVELLANPDAGAAFSAGKVTAAQVYFNGKAFRSFTLDGNDSLAALQGTSKMVVPTSVQISDGVNVTIVKNTDKGSDLILEPDFKVSVYAADKDGKPVGEALTEAIAAGNYVTVIEAVAGDYKGGKVYLPYTIEPIALDNLTVFEGETVADEKFVFTGKALELGVANGGTALEVGKDVEVTFKNAADNKACDVVNVGTYYAEIKGLGVYAGEKAKTAMFKVVPFNLNDAKVTVDDVVASDTVPTHPTRVEIIDEDHPENNAVLDPSLVNLVLPSGDIFVDNKQYTFAAGPADPKNPNVTGGRNDVKVNKIGKAATFGYDGEAWKDSFATDLSQKKPVYFTKDLVKVFNGKTELKAGTDYAFEVRDEDGALVSDAFDAKGRLVKPGTYTVKVTVTNTQNFEVGGSATATVKVSNGAIDADATSWISYGNKVIAGNELDAEYNGVGYDVDGFSFLVKNAKGEDITEACELKIVDQDGKEYTDGVLKNAGTYTVTVVSDAYEISNQTPVKFTISPFALDDVKLGAMKQEGNSGISYVPLKFKSETDKTEVPYEIKDLGVERLVAEKYQGFAGNNDVKMTLEKWDVKNEKWDAVATAKSEGQFRLTVAPLNSTVAANYKFATEAGTVVDFRVVDENKVKFYDVPLDAWYFENVADAANKKWIKGYNGTKFFGPNDAITRADVCVIMARMAGKDLTIDKEKPENSGDNQFFETPFADVDGNMYYAEAIAWAANTGIVKGDANTGAFRPTDQISRQEFAAMMARYAEKLGKDVSADASELDKYADASSVADWAKGYVAWAVKAGIMGQNTSVLWPTEDITRAAVATMLVRF